jgi:hypothetical protein
MAGTGGIAHVSAYGAAGLCAVANYGPSGTDQVLNLHCYDMEGALVDTAFVANFTNRTDSAILGYLWSKDPTPPVTGNWACTVMICRNAASELGLLARTGVWPGRGGRRTTMTPAVRDQPARSRWRRRSSILPDWLS